MGIAMGNFSASHQSTLLPQHLNNMVFNLVHMLTGKQLHIIPEQAVIHHIVEGANAIAFGHSKIVHAVIWCCMHTTSTSIGGDMITQQYRNISLVERMFSNQIFQRRPLTAGQLLVILNLQTLHHRFKQ